MYLYVLYGIAPDVRNIVYLIDLLCVWVYIYGEKYNLLAKTFM